MAEQRNSSDPEIGVQLDLERRRTRLASSAARSSPAGVSRELDQEELHVLNSSLQKYEVLGRLMFGGQGTVYKARQRGAQRTVAIKVLLDGPLATERQRFRFEREIALIARLRHPNIVSLHDCGVIRGRLYYTMDFVEGRPIDDHAILHDLAPREIVRLIARVARAVHHAHQSGVIHRDLKPENILVDERGEPHILDFGLAKDALDDADNPHSQPGVMMGTLPYLSPEQTGAGDGRTDVRSDVYALGVVLYTLLTDLFPYPIDGTPEEIRREIANTEPMPLRRAIRLSDADRAPRIHEVNRDLEAVLARALAKAKAERYQSAAEFADDLDRFLGGEAVSARGASAWYLTRKFIRRNRLAVAVSSVVATTLVGSAAALTFAYFEVRAQRDTARHATGKAFDLFDLALREVEEAVRPLPGGVAVRDRLIALLTDELPQLEALSRSDASLRPIAAALLARRGDIELEQGRREKAHALFTAYLEASRKLAGEHPDEVRYRDQISEAYLKLGMAEETPQQTLEEGIRHADAVLASPRAAESSRFVACQLLYQYTLTSLWERDDEAASACVERAFGLLPENPDREGTDRKWGHLAARLMNLRGRLLLRQGDAEGGLSQLYATLAIRERLAKVHPADADVRMELMRSYLQLAESEWDRGKEAAAHSLSEKAAEMSSQFEVLDPTATKSDRERYAVHHDAAVYLLERGNLPAAWHACREAARLATRLQDNGLNSGSDYLAQIRCVEGRLHMTDGDLGAAQGCIAESERLCRELVAADPNNHQRANLLAIACRWMGKVTREMGDPELAVSHYEESLAIRQQLSAQQPTSVEARLLQIESQINLASALLWVSSPAADAKADDLLSAAEQLLLRLDSAGQLASEQRRRAAYLKGIQDNRHILQKRLGVARRAS